MAVVLILNRERHVAAMTRWAVHVARGQRQALHILRVRSGQAAETYSATVPGAGGGAATSLWGEVEEALLELELRPNRELVDEASASQIPVCTRDVCHRTRLDGVLTYLKESQANWLVVGRQLSARSDQSEESQWAAALFEQAPCRILFLRLGNHDGRRCRSILAPTRDGVQGHGALRLGYALVHGSEGSLTAAIVEPMVGEDAMALGDVLIDRVLDRAQIDRGDPQVIRKVILSDRASNGLSRETEAGDYDLLLLSESKRGRLRRHLFGAVTDKAINRPGGLAVGVVRESLPASLVLRSRLRSWWSTRLPPMSREQRLKIFERLQVGSSLSMDYLVLIGLSTFIASLGLMQSSPAVVIGAMLVAPLMTPLLGAGLGLVQGNVPMIRTCSVSIVIGFLLAFAISFLTGLATQPNMTLELEARCHPGPLDLGVALVSGIAASYCLARPGLSSALAGVAIAAALVPPIATAGIVAAYLGWAASGPPALLFGTNVVSIILGAALTFYLLGLRGSENERSAIWVRRIVLVLLVAFVSLSIYYLITSP